MIKAAVQQEAPAVAEPPKQEEASKKKDDGNDPSYSWLVVGGAITILAATLIYRSVKGSK